MRIKINAGYKNKGDLFLSLCLNIITIYSYYLYIYVGILQERWEKRDSHILYVYMLEREIQLCFCEIQLESHLHIHLAIQFVTRSKSHGAR